MTLSTPPSDNNTQHAKQHNDHLEELQYFALFGILVGFVVGSMSLLIGMVPRILFGLNMALFGDGRTPPVDNVTQHVFIVIGCMLLGFGVLCVNAMVLLQRWKWDECEEEGESEDTIVRVVIDNVSDEENGEQVCA